MALTAPPKRPEPLTTCKESGELYTRFADVEEEIGETLRVPIGDWPSLVAESRRPKIKLQTLVYMCRHSQHDQRVFGAVMHALLYRIQPIIYKKAQGFDKITYELIVTEVEKKIVELILAETPTRRSEYCEIDPSRVVAQTTIRVIDRRKDEPKPGQFLRPPDDDGVTVVDGLPSNDLDPLDHLIKQQDDKKSLIKRLLPAVKDSRHREAFILRELRNWPYESPDPTTPSLVTHFKPMSKRQIHNWIKQAKKDIRAAYGDLT